MNKNKRALGQIPLAALRVLYGPRLQIGLKRVGDRRLGDEGVPQGLAVG
jgi:hypothetical protein